MATLFLLLHYIYFQPYIAKLSIELYTLFFQAPIQGTLLLNGERITYAVKNTITEAKNRDMYGHCIARTASTSIMEHASPHVHKSCAKCANLVEFENCCKTNVRVSL